MPITQQQREIFQYALKHLEAERARLDDQIAEVHQQLGTKAKTKTSVPVETASEPAPTKTKRKMSASARKRIAAAQKLRWKVFHAKGKTDATETPAAPVTKKAAGKKAKKTTAKKATTKAAKKTAKKRDNSDIPF